MRLGAITILVKRETSQAKKVSEKAQSARTLTVGVRNGKSGFNTCLHSKTIKAILNSMTQFMSGNVAKLKKSMCPINAQHHALALLSDLFSQIFEILLTGSLVCPCFSSFHT